MPRYEEAGVGRGGRTADSVECCRICSSARQRSVEISQVVAIMVVDERRDAQSMDGMRQRKRVE